jgi:UDP-N-acetylmuramate dehydrogenase
MPDLPIITKQLSLKSKNTLGLNSQAEYFALFSTAQELEALVHWAESRALPVRVLGGGSNVLMPERVPGLVVQASSDRISVVSTNDDTTVVDVDAGKNWHQWVIESLAYGYGLENLALIPGSVGASPVQNIGAYGVEVSELLVSVTGYCLSQKAWLTIPKSECDFAYRDSVFKNRLKGDFIITSVRFELSNVFSPNLEYAPLNTLDQNALTAQELTRFVADVRSAKLPDPANIPNAGSFFKNPVISSQKAETLKLTHPSLPVYPLGLDSTHVKVAAGWLIEHCGFKGKAFGPVAMYEKQALVLTADGSASLSDVTKLKELVQEAVAQTFDVHLEPEPQLFTS